ncbi:MAG: hypothetical protein KIT68_00730 [Phycisphaeraceae bacterium]|nr:hypothetical protein [Phycisphaeraceae bacterium]
MRAFTIRCAVLLSLAGTASGLSAQTCAPHFEPVGSGLPGPVLSLTVGDLGSGQALFVGGQFGPAGVLAAFDGSAWSALPAGLGGNAGDRVTALAVLDGELLAGGFFALNGGASAHAIARLDGAQWTSLTGDSSGFAEVRRLLVHDGTLLACGQFSAILGTSVHKIASYNGQTWLSLPGGGTTTGTAINAMAYFDPDGDGPAPAELIVAGEFTQIGAPAPTAANFIARWDGAAWHALGTGLNGPVNALAVYDEDGPGGAPARLFVAGNFTTAGGATATRIARWDGANWSQVGIGYFQGLAGGTRGALDLAVYDEDGPGPDRPVLYVGGDFTYAGGLQPARGVARWSGLAWNYIGPVSAPGVSGGYVTSLMPMNDALYIGGTFTSAGGQPAANIARYRTCHHCLADVATAGSGLASPDGFITGDDFDLFIQAFFTGQRDGFGRLVADVATAGGAEPYSDGFLTGEDFDLFIMSFFTGC